MYFHFALHTFEINNKSMRLLVWSATNGPLLLNKNEEIIKGVLENIISVLGVGVEFGVFPDKL